MLQPQEGLPLPISCRCILGLFGIHTGLLSFGGGTFGIVISLVVIVVAALNLILILILSKMQPGQVSPKYMEWFGAFGLIVTLVWLYIEFLRLLARLSSRN